MDGLLRVDISSGSPISIFLAWCFGPTAPLHLEAHAVAVPTAVVTLTLILPNFALAGALTLMRVALHGAYLVRTLVPNFTVPVPR